MNKIPMEGIETRLEEIARRFPYPPTPDLSQAVMRRLALRSAARPAARVRRLAWVAAIILVLLGALISVPPVRAQILEFLQIGVVRILKSPPAVPQSTATLLPSLFDLAGKTSLEEARLKAHFPILLPVYPPDAGLPDAVYMQNLGGQSLILVWLDPLKPRSIRFSLNALEPGSYSLDKIQPEVLENTLVNDSLAVWTTGPYIVELRNGNTDVRRLINGHVLIWTQGSITYRLETDQSLEEAVRIAESLKPGPAPYPHNNPGTLSP
jgi:hypothetical protein